MLVFNLITSILLLAVGGLLVRLHFGLHKMRSDLNKLPVLGDQFTSQMINARATLAQLNTAMEENAPMLSGDIKKAENALQDLDFVLARAEKILTQFDDKIRSPQGAKPMAAPTAPQQPVTMPLATRTPEIPGDVEAKVVASTAQTKVAKVVESKPEPRNSTEAALRRMASAYQQRKGQNQTVSESELRAALEGRL